VEIVHPSTIAEGIAVGAPVNGTLAVRDVSDSGGGFVAVSDEEILGAVRTLAVAGGVLAEPAGAAAFAGLRGAVEKGFVDSGGTVVVLITGSLTPAGRPLEVHADLAEVRRALPDRR
jgi:threonine synthase